MVPFDGVHALLNNVLVFRNVDAIDTFGGIGEAFTQVLACLPFAHLHLGVCRKGKSLTCLGVVFPTSFVITTVVARIFTMSPGHHLAVKATHVHAFAILATTTHQRVGVPSSCYFSSFGIEGGTHSLPFTVFPLPCIHHAIFQPQHAIAMTTAIKHCALIANVAFSLQHLPRSVAVKRAVLEVAGGEKRHSRQCREPKITFGMVYFSFHNSLAMM